MTPDLIIGDALTKLAIARGGLLDDFTSHVYLDRLGKFNAELVARACVELSYEPRGDYEMALPDVGHIVVRVQLLERQDAEQVARAKILPARHHDETEPTFHCLLCFDEPNAWRLFWCPGKGAFRSQDKPDRAAGTSTYPCQRYKEHAGHTYAERCECSDTNPVIARARELMAAARPKKQLKGRHAD